MPKRDRGLAGLQDTLVSVQHDTANLSLDTPPSRSEEEDRCKRQKIIDHISAQTAVDPSDQLRSDQLSFVPRSYQLELAELAKAGNVLVCLDTGSGKTLISVLLLQHVHQIQDAQRTPSPPQSLPESVPQRRKVSFFLVNLVPLVHQQSSVIAGNSNLSVGKLYGELKDAIRGKGNKFVVDSWRKPQWSALLESHQVIVSTAQCFLDALIHGFIKMDDLNLIIFDEVHHALKNHPFFRIMKYYRLAPEQERPKIFGMTASPIFTSTGQFDDASRYLQEVMNARIHTVSKDTLKDLQEVKQKPEELVIEFDPYLTALDDEVGGVQMSALTKEMIDEFGKDPALDEDAELDVATEHFENEVRPKLEYTMRHLGPVGCDLLWHSTLLEYRSRARKWVNIDRSKRALVNDDWVIDESLRTSTTVTSSESQESRDSADGNSDSAAAAAPQSTASGLGLGLAVAHLSTNGELNQRILLHMRSQPTLPDVLDLDSGNASHKILRLIQTLKCFEPSAKDFCAIVFVERRQTATLLVELIKRVSGLEFIHPEFLLGHENGSANGGAPGMDWHDQVQVLNRFRRRKPTNLLVATSIAEEGLDIQAANLVIRFDLFNRHISFLQSRGRARAKQSRFILMAETGNHHHAQAILNAFNTEANRAKWLTDIADTDHDSSFYSEEWKQKLQIEADEAASSQECIYEPRTGARLFPEDAPTLISHYAATLHSEYLKDAVLAYKLDSIYNGAGVPNTFKCVLELPSTSAVRSVESGECRSKKQAKRMAAFKACHQLRQLGDLDEYLMPKLSDRAVLEAAGTGAVDPHHKAWRGSGVPVHVPVKKMDGWARLVNAADEKTAWHATYLALDEYDSSCQPLMLLSRGALPETKLLKLMHSATGKSKGVKAKSLGKLPALSNEELEHAKRFTRYVFQLVNRKDDNGNAGRMKADAEPAVLVVPVRKAQNAAEVQNIAELQPDFPASLDLTTSDLSQADPHQLQNRILVRQHGCHSTALYKFQSIRRDLSPNSPISADDQAATYLSQHLKMYGRRNHPSQSAPEDLFDVLSTQLATSPLFEVMKLPKVQNLLSRGSAPKTAPPAPRLIVPHFYALHPFPSGLLSSVLLLPSILTRYDQLLLAHFCNTHLFAGRLETDLVLEALAAPSAGSGFDYERLEFLGDTFLKLVATCHTFTTELGRTEAELHLANKAILTNVRLLKEAKRLELEKYGVFAGLIAKRFVGPVVGEVGGKLVEESSDEEGEMGVVKEKTLSDIVEALIGCALVSSASTTLALSVCVTFNLLPPTIVTFRDFNTLLLSLKQQSIAENWADRISTSGLVHLESLFCHTYVYPHLGLEAFTHPSLLASILPSYQRLEFLGDAWIDFYIVRKIFDDHPESTPGEMTAVKGVLASNAALSALGVELGLYKYIASDSAVLCETIGKYVTALEGVEREQQYWTGLGSKVVVPKAIADVVEASFASIVVDSGFDEEVVEKVFGRIFRPFYDRWCRWDGVRVVEVRRVVGYAYAMVRRALAANGRIAMVRVQVQGLPDLQPLENDEEQLVHAMLRKIRIELQLDTTTVGRLETLPRSILHLHRAHAITKHIHRIQHRISTLLPRQPLLDEPNTLAEAVASVDELEHLALQLCTTLGWKRAFQPLAEQAAQRAYSLAELRGLVMPEDGEMG